MELHCVWKYLDIQKEKFKACISPPQWEVEIRFSVSKRTKIVKCSFSPKYERRFHYVQNHKGSLERNISGLSSSSPGHRRNKVDQEKYLAKQIPSRWKFNYFNCQQTRELQPREKKAEAETEPSERGQRKRGLLWLKDNYLSTSTSQCCAVSGSGWAALSQKASGDNGSCVVVVGGGLTSLGVSWHGHSLTQLSSLLMLHLETRVSVCSELAAGCRYVS